MISISLSRFIFVREIVALFGVFVALVAVPFFANAQTSTFGQPAETLRTLIEQKSVELQEIERQREVLEKNLESISQSSKSLKKELQIIDANVNQLNLLLKANTVMLEKLDLEIDSLQKDATETEEKIQHQKAAVLRLFALLQQKDKENLFTVFLRNTSLSQSVAEARSIATLGTSLSSTIVELKNLQRDLADRLDAVERKRFERAVERNNLINRQIIVQEQKNNRQNLLITTKNQEQIYQNQLSEIEKIQAKISKEIEQYESVLRKEIDPNLLPVPRRFALMIPVAGASLPKNLSQGYGYTPFAAKHYASRYHNGIDIAMPLGTAVVSAEKGVVINVGNQDAYRGCYKGAYGKFVVVKHENGLTTLYGHLSRYIVKIGDRVDRGDVIGYVGSTGYATGPHLHFTVFATQTITPARAGYPEGTKPSSCGPMPVGGDLDPTLYL